ncbi:MAG: carbamate kinase [Phototrophicaceae bacterium]
MIEKLAIVAIGGNSLITDADHSDVPHQWDAVRETSEHLAQMVANGWHIVITHGNGPQVGYAMRRSEIAQREGIHGAPLDSLVADTQGSIGYMIQQAMDNSLRRLGINRTCATIVTQIRVDADDPDFENPSKPVGGFMDEAEAMQRRDQDGWHVMEDAGRGWRRLVPSPLPQAIQEINAIQALMLSGYVVIAGGGGGIPVIRTDVGSLRGVEAVIDKDRASSLLAQQLRADLLLISTGVEKVALDFGTPNQRDLDTITLQQANDYMSNGQFPKGSMLPKIEAAVAFVRNGGPQAIITNPENLTRALIGETGTRIIPSL